MARKKISNELWKALQPLLPVVEPSTKGGRPRVDDRAALNGILFVLHTGIPWEDLPKELGFGSGMTCWRRCGSGRPTAFGSGCIWLCSSAYANTTRSTGAEPVSTVQRWPAPGGRADGAESNGSRQAR